MSHEAYRLDLIDAEIAFYPDFLSQDEASQLFMQLEQQLDWHQAEIRMFGKTSKIPRLQAWYGDPAARYRYSGIDLDPQPLPASLMMLRDKLEAFAQSPFNGVLANLYRDGNDSMGWHSDDEKSLGPNPVIASVNLGASRRFQLKHRQQPDRRAEVELTHGSLLLMSGPTQHFWHHGVPKQRRISEPRINLTFRHIKADP